jgi:hypothetical protein
MPSEGKCRIPRNVPDERYIYEYVGHGNSEQGETQMCCPNITTHIPSESSIKLELFAIRALKTIFRNYVTEYKLR